MKTINPVLSVVMLLSLIGFLTVTPSAHAGEGGPFSIGARAVTFAPNDGSTSWSGGIQARLALPLMFAAEASIDYREYEVGNSKAHDYPLQLSALIYILPKIIVVQPYILGGGGWYNTTVEAPGLPDNTDSRFAPHVGAGIDFSLGSKWFIDTTYRYVFLKEVGNIDDAGSMVTVGINYRI